MNDCAFLIFPADHIGAFQLNTCDHMFVFQVKAYNTYAIRSRILGSKGA